MKILLLTDGILPFVMGGMQKHSRLLVEYFGRQGVEVMLYHYSENNVSDEEVKAQFSDEVNRKLSFKTFQYLDQGKLPGHYLRAQKAMSKQYLDQYLSDNVEYDFIYTKGFMGWAMIEQRVALGIKTPIGVKFHGMNMFQKQADLKGTLQKYLLRKPVRTIMNLADVVFSYGGRITDIIKTEKIRPEKIIEVSAGIEKGWLREDHLETRADHSTRFLFVGRYDRVKGLPELNKAIINLPLEMEWSLTFVGPIPKEHQLQLSNVHYLGEVKNSNELKEIYDRHDVLLNPSISEGMPNVILEAMARGLSVIASDVGATALLVNENTGVLIAPGKSDQIKTAMLLFGNLSNHDLLRMKNTSRQLISANFIWEAIIEQLINKIKSSQIA
jgi:glycosyltransferase involved in cell wall biosynthesis